jgi:hypothetical protein
VFGLGLLKQITIGLNLSMSSGVIGIRFGGHNMTIDNDTVQVKISNPLPVFDSRSRHQEK